MTDFIYLSPRPDVLADGRPLDFGDTVTLGRSESEANQRLLDSGGLVAVPKTAPAVTKKKVAAPNDTDSKENS